MKEGYYFVKTIINNNKNTSVKIFRIIGMVFLLSACGVNVDAPPLSSVPLSVEKEIADRQKIAEELEKDKIKAVKQKQNLLLQQSKSETYFKKEFKAVEPNAETVENAKKEAN